MMRGPILLTGATGYVGGRLAARLLERGERLRCLVRSESKLRSRPWTRHEGLEVVEDDLADEARLAEHMRGCSVAYYLVHSMMIAGKEYRARDAELAARFSRAAQTAGVRRIVYLGGLGETGAPLSEHLASRREVESVLRDGPVPVTVLRAAMIIGSGSASFEILRYLVERLPVMITPRWVRTECQPIAIRDVLEYLVRVLDVPETTGRTLDIGGTDVMTYEQIMAVLAERRGLRRRIIVPVPVLTPRLSSLWIHLITPLSHRIARPLAAGLRNRVVCRDDEAQRLMPFQRLSISEAIDRAIRRSGANDVPTHWADAGVMPGDPDWAGGTTFVDERSMPVRASRAAVFAAICRVGGGHGYYAQNWLWRIRGAMDRLVGGPGLRRGRRDPHRIGVGDALDFWRVIGCEENRELRLRAEMKLPGVAELTLRIDPADAPGDNDEEQVLVQTARFKPRGLAGLLYWYAVFPLHGFVFKGLMKGIAHAAEASERGEHAAGER